MKSATLLTADKDITPQQYLENIAKRARLLGDLLHLMKSPNLFVFLCSPRASYIVAQPTILTAVG